MPLFNSLTKVATKPVPRMISPKGHAIVDYITIGAFLASAVFFWRRNKRASLASLISGGAQLVVGLLTDYPGGVEKIIPFRLHQEIDLGLAAMTATMPEFMAFKDEAEKKFFLAQGAVITANNELTKPARSSRKSERGSYRARAA